MPRTNTSGVSNAGPVEESTVLRADGSVSEVNDMEPERRPEPESAPERKAPTRKARSERS